eukprot:gene18170-24602_t
MKLSAGPSALQCSARPSQPRSAIPMGGQTPPRVGRPAARMPVATNALEIDQEVSVRQTYVSPEARKGLFATGKEQFAEVETEISGTIPSWLSGSMLVNGGGKHWAKTGKMRFREFCTEIPTDNPFDQAANVLETMGFNSKFEPVATDNASVNLIPLGDGSVLAISETKAAQYRVDPKTLQTLGQVQFDDGVQGSLTTAHPKKLPNGDFVNFSRTLPFGGFNVYTQNSSTLKRKQIAYIPDRKPEAPSWVHDIALSENHVIICETPAFFNMGVLTFGGTAQYGVVDWEPELGTRIHVVPLNGGEVKTYTAPPFFTFHFANAHEDATTGDIYVDMASYDDPDIVTDLMLDNIAAFPGKDVSKAGLRRLTIPKQGTAVTAAVPLLKNEADAGNFAEFPAINPTYAGKKNQYTWALVATRPTNLGNSLGKFDLEAGTCKVFHEEGSMPGEPVFLANPGATEEDDGVLLSTHMNSDGRSCLLVLDAKSMTVLGRASLPYSIPYRFHGTFIPN